MKINCDVKFATYLIKNWNDPKMGPKVQDMVEAIVAELKKDYREYQRKHPRMSDEAVAHWEGLICDVQDLCFWEKVEHMWNFNFEF